MPASFTVVTWNAWHGLETGEFWVTPAESAEENAARLEHQVRQLAAAHPDLIFLQEVNPLPARADALVAGLKTHGRSYTQVHQVDACGIRPSEGRALIPGLNNGLVVLAKETLRLRKLEGLRLSGDLGRCESTTGYQLEELRYALVAEITMPGTHARYLVVSLHLHSGLEAGGRFVSRLQALHARGQFPRYPWLQWAIDRARLRRIGELDVLMRSLYARTREGTYAGILIGGDFNFEPDFPEYDEALMLRLQDTHTAAVREGELPTADPQRNRRIHLDEGQALPMEFETELAPEPGQTRDVVRAAYREELQRPRRIDYLFSQAFLPDYCLRQDLFGEALDAAGLPGSDHYGIRNTYTRDPASCHQAVQMRSVSGSWHPAGP